VRLRRPRPEAKPATADPVAALDRDLARLAAQLRIMRGRGEPDAVAHLNEAIDTHLDERRRLAAKAPADHRA
jgi:hypothetical protein